MNKVFPCLLILSILIINSFRFYDLKNVPAGYHVDEYSAAVTSRCFGLEGTNAWGAKNGAFFTVAYGSPRPATFIWPAALWGKVFDFTVPTLRILCVMVTAFGIVGIFALGWRVGGLFVGLWAALSASLAPHIFVMSRVAFESLFAASFLSWGLFFLLRLERKTNIVAASIFFALSLYSYPPTRVFIPIFLLFYFMIFRQWQKTPMSWGLLIVFTTLLTLPILHGIFSGSLQTRFNEISILAAVNHKPLSLAWVKEVATLFFHNFGLHLSFDFLFLKGDASPVHSTTQHGLFSWLDYAAWGAALSQYVWQKCFKGVDGFLKGQGPMVALCIGGFLLSILPSALTNSEIPNALRISLHWPLVSLLTGLLIAQIQTKWPWFSVVTLVIAGLFAGQFLYIYFNDYRKRSIGFFHDWVVKDSQNARTDKEFLMFLAKYRLKDFHSRYFLMNKKNVGCVESLRIWESIYKGLGGGRRY